MGWGSVELEPAVDQWLSGLTDDHFGHAAFYIDLLAERGVHLGERTCLAERHTAGERAMSRKNWEEVKRERLSGAAAQDGYNGARRAFEMGERVRLLREDHGMSQRELAERIGSTQPAIARLEAGGVSPRLGTLERIAEALNRALVIDFQTRTALRPDASKRPTKAPA